VDFPASGYILIVNDITLQTSHG